MGRCKPSYGRKVNWRAVVSLWLLLVLRIGEVQCKNITVSASDPQITYSPLEEWLFTENNSLASTTSSGATATFKFRGVAFYLESMVTVSSSEMSISVDGHVYDIDPTPLFHPGIHTIFSKTGLKGSRTHVVVVSKVSQPSPSVSNGLGLNVSSMIYTTAKQLSSGQIAGIVIGTLLAVALVLFICFVLWRRRRRFLDLHSDPITFDGPFEQSRTPGSSPSSPHSLRIPEWKQQISRQTSPAVTLGHDPEKLMRLEKSLPTDIINNVPIPSLPEPPISILRSGPTPSKDGIVIVERYQNDKKSSPHDIEKPPSRVNVSKSRPSPPPVKSSNRLMFFVTNPSKISLSTNSSHKSKKSKQKEANMKTIESTLAANNNGDAKPLDLLESLSVTSDETDKVVKERRRLPQLAMKFFVTNPSPSSHSSSMSHMPSPSSVSTWRIARRRAKMPEFSVGAAARELEHQNEAGSPTPLLTNLSTQPASHVLIVSPPVPPPKDHQRGTNIDREHRSNSKRERRRDIVDTQEPRSKREKAVRERDGNVEKERVKEKERLREKERVKDCEPENNRDREHEKRAHKRHSSGRPLPSPRANLKGPRPKSAQARVPVPTFTPQIIPPPAPAEATVPNSITADVNNEFDPYLAYGGKGPANVLNGVGRPSPARLDLAEEMTLRPQGAAPARNPWQKQTGRTIFFTTNPSSRSSRSDLGDTDSGHNSPPPPLPRMKPDKGKARAK